MDGMPQRRSRSATDGVTRPLHLVGAGGNLLAPTSVIGSSKSLCWLLPSGTFIPLSLFSTQTSSRAHSKDCHMPSSQVDAAFARLKTRGFMRDVQHSAPHSLHPFPRPFPYFPVFLFSLKQTVSWKFTAVGSQPSAKQRDLRANMLSPGSLLRSRPQNWDRLRVEVS